jgi:phage tail sheath protein FI
MATITPKTFPGVYTTIVDKSFFTPATSRFKPGLIGVASKGPFDTPTPVQSLKDFVNLFGRPITTTYTTNTTTEITTPDGSGYFLADAVDSIADFTDAITVVRIGNRYTDLAPADGASGANSYTLYSPSNAPRVQAMLAQGDVYLRVVEQGVPSTVNVSVVSAGGGTIALDTAGDPLAAPYVAATIGYSPYDKAANLAEGVLYAYTYGSDSSQYTDAVFSSVGSISGYKNQFQFYCSANASAITVGDVFKIKETNKDSTHEVRVKSTLIDYGDTSGTVYLEKTDIPQIGYQALPLQDNYASAALYKPTGKLICLYLKAATEGTWANGADSSEGLYLKVRPGSDGGTKKLEVYWDSALTETHDNITDDPSDPVNFWTVRLEKGKSAYVYVEEATGLLSDNWCAANTVAPWDARFFGSTPTTGLPLPMPLGATNAGWLAITVGNVQDTGGQFTKGYNGENPQDTDWIGDLDPTTDTMSGIRAFEDTDTVEINILAAPMDNISIAVMEQMGRTCAKINAMSLCDVPAGLNAREAIDWHNGKLPTQDGTRLDNRNVAVYWNWFVRANRWGETKWVPPTLGTLRAMGYTFNVDKPWYAAAGENRGYLPDALRVQFDRVSEDTKQAMYGNGNSVNPILKIKGRHYLYGERTMQRAESKLTAVHNVIMVNWVLSGMSTVARRYVFDPNDAELLIQLKLAFTEFLDRIVNERGMEQYNLVMDDRNNTAETRNNREVIVDLEMIPTDVAERIFINAIVRESGAVLNTLS